MHSRRFKYAIFDSNVWIAFLLETDIFHYKAMRIIGLYEKQKYQIIIPIIILLELIIVLTREGMDINQTKKIIHYIKSTKSYEIHTIENNELIELALQNACQIKLKSLDYLILLHYAKFKTEKFESFDSKVLKYINLYKSNDKKKH